MNKLKRALLVGTLAGSLIATPAFADNIPPPPPGGGGSPPPASGGTANQGQPQNSGRSASKAFWNGYVISGAVCTAVSPMVDAAITGGRKKRQLVFKEVAADIVGCWTFGVGGWVLKAVWKPTSRELYFAHVAWLYDQLPARKAKFFSDVIGDRKPWTYPSLRRMLAELKAAGIKVETFKKFQHHAS